MINRVTVAMCALLLPLAATAGPARYRVTEVPVPAASPCVAGLWQNMGATAIDDLGLTTSQLLCYKIFDPATQSVLQAYHGVVSAPHFGSVILAEPPPAISAQVGNIDNRGTAYGALADTGLSATRWTLGGGVEQVFEGAGCPFLDLDFAAGASPRGYVVGWALRRPNDPTSPSDFCAHVDWVIRKPNGEQTYGPLNGSATDINIFDVAVGSSDFNAVRVHVPSGRIQVLGAGDETLPAQAVDINDRSEAAGSRATQPDLTQFCGPSIALRWETDGRERRLRHLPGAASSRASAVGYDGETVGSSGPANYCGDDVDLLHRAVIWRGAQPIDLNSLIPAGLGVRLTQAVDVNRRGQIVATGYRPEEPRQSCPQLEFNEQTQTYEVNLALRCISRHVYLLTPTGH